MLIEEHVVVLTNSYPERSGGGHTFPKSISLKRNSTTGFQTHYDITAEHINHYATKITKSKYRCIHSVY